MRKFSRKKLIDFGLVFLATIIFCVPLFNETINVSHDLTFHLNRFAGIANAFEEGQILPKIYPFANYGFGYATALFYCDIFLYPFAILYHFNVPAIICYKLCIFTYTLIGTCLMFYVAGKIFKDNKIALLSAILYLFANYHLQNVYIRSALGEVLAMTWIPLIVYAFYEILICHKDAYKLLGIAFSLLVMSHLISSLLYGILFFVFIVIFVVLNRKDLKLIKQVLITILKGALLALLLCAWYLLPMLEQMLDQKFWLDANKAHNNLASTIQKPYDIFKVFAVNDYHSFDIYHNANIGTVYILLTALYLFVNKNKYINIVLVVCFIFYLLVIGFIPAIPQLKIIQFLFRFYVLMFPLIVLVITYNLNYLKNNKRVMVVLSIVIACFSIINVYILNSEIKKDAYQLENKATLSQINDINVGEYEGLDYDHDELGGAEYLPLTVNMNYKTEGHSIKYINENGEKHDYAWEYERSFSKITYVYEDDEDKEILFPLSYYKGYKAYEIIDGEKVQIPVYNYDLFKLVSIKAKAGKHTYVVFYEGTTVQKFSLAISALTLVIFVGYEIIYKKKVRGIK